MSKEPKKKVIKFVTLYPKCHNPGLMKDVGQIPFILGKNYTNIDAKLVSCIVNLNNVNTSQMEEMQIEKIPFPFKSDFLAGVIYILKNGKSVDWFNFYHGGRKVYYWTKLYKWLNPVGKVYLKLDLGYDGCEKYSGSRKEKNIFNKTLEVVDVASVESEAIRTIAQRFCKKELKIINNGYVENEKLKIKKTSEREKTLITVGRLGTIEKATNLLLEGFAITADKHDWTLKLVGPIDEEFETYIDSFFKIHPDLRKRVIFIGTVYNKDELYELYNSSRVFILPSRWEGFPLVGPEALYCGCRMILTDMVPPVKELTANGMYGNSIKTNDVNAIAKGIMREVCRSEEEAEPLSISAYARTTLSWNKICEELYHMMEQESKAIY